MNHCNNCNHKLTGKYCADCGQIAITKRIDAHYIMHELEHVLHFERGILFTIKELLLRPGQNVKRFIAEDRSKLVKPIIFIIITSLLYTVIAHFFHIEKGYVDFKESEKSATGSIFNWVENHYGYGNIIMGVFIALWLKLFFRKYGYNFFEILILLCFVMGMGMLILAVFALLEGLTKISLTKISGIIAVCYCIWAIGQFFDKSKVMSYVKSLTSYTLGMALFTTVAVVLGHLIDLF